jgi:hypothetical protein
MPVHLPALFIFVAMLIESTMSLTIPRSIKHSPLGAFGFSSSSVIVPELAFYAVFITGKPSRATRPSCPSHHPLQPSSFPSSVHLSWRSSTARGLRSSSIVSLVRPIVAVPIHLATSSYRYLSRFIIPRWCHIPPRYPSPSPLPFSFLHRYWWSWPSCPRACTHSNTQGRGRIPDVGIA